MSMFDEFKCLYPLPVPGANALNYQTKDTPAQFCDDYEVRTDGTLWHKAYDTEDQSELAKWHQEHPGQEPPWSSLSSLRAMCGCMTRVNPRWEQVVDFRGEIRFYTTLGAAHDGWIEWSALFNDGKLIDMRLVEHQPETC